MADVRASTLHVRTKLEVAELVKQRITEIARAGDTIFVVVDVNQFSGPRARSGVQVLGAFTKPDTALTYVKALHSFTPGFTGLVPVEGTNGFAWKLHGATNARILILETTLHGVAE